MLRAARAAVLAVFAAASLLGSSDAQAEGRLTISSGGMSRNAMVIERDRLKLRRRPLIIVLQRSGGVNTRGRRRHGLEQAATSAKPIFVYPEALGGQWPVNAGPDTDRDLQFLRNLVDHLIDQGRVDSRRIFVVGTGSGGPLAYRAACGGLGRQLAGLAAIVSGMPQDLGACAPPPLAYIAVNNAQDPRIPYEGGKASAGDATYDSLGAEQSLQSFAKINGCGAKREEKRLPERKDEKGLRGAVFAMTGCKAPTELIRIDAASHHVPGRSADGESMQDNFDAHRAVWEFLQRNGA